MIKVFLAEVPILQQPTREEPLYLYLAVSDSAISAALIRVENSIQHPIYYVSHALHDAELRYTPMEKLAYLLIMSSCKLWPYFLEHRVVILTNYPLKQVMHRPDVSDQMIKWAVELRHFDLIFESRTATKG